MAAMRTYVVTSTPRKGETVELARVKAQTGGLALRGQGEIISGDARSLGFNVKRNQSVKECRRANGKLRRTVKAKPVKA